MLGSTVFFPTDQCSLIDERNDNTTDYYQYFLTSEMLKSLCSSVVIASNNGKECLHRLIELYKNANVKTKKITIETQ